jgi:hypothetical protein
MKSKQELIHEVIDLELAMFLKVRAREPVSCQENPEAFRFHKGGLVFSLVRSRP